LILIAFTYLIAAQNIVVNEDKATIYFLFLDDDIDGILSDFKFTRNLNFNDLENAILSERVLRKQKIQATGCETDLRNKYFKSDEFPLLNFKSDSFSTEGDGLILNGILTIKGISKAANFRFTRTSSLLTGKTSINASDFDIFIHSLAIRNGLTITIALPYSK
jgi:polyisoprenoid-binding protein YceI